MRRHEFEHVIAAAANVVDEDEFVVVGSQAILGACLEPPEALLQSIEADMYPARDPAKAVILDGKFGDGSQFHRSFGYYAHGVGPETAEAPAGWQDRLIRVEIPPRQGPARCPVALCLEPHDLVLAKCAAGRDRDWDYAREALRAGIVRPSELLERAVLLPVDADHQVRVRSMLEAIIAELGL